MHTKEKNQNKSQIIKIIACENGKMYYLRFNKSLVLGAGVAATGFIRKCYEFLL